MPGFLKAIREAAAAAPVNQDLVFTRRKLWDDIERTLWALETAQNHFEQATEPSLIDCYIYEWNAAHPPPGTVTYDYIKIARKTT